jgi:sarcosine/dimethylglycine N-methyltransferase
MLGALKFAMPGTEMQPKRQQPPAPLCLEVVMGPEFAEMAVNLGRNLMEGRVRIIQAVMAKGPFYAIV